MHFTIVVQVKRNNRSINCGEGGKASYNPTSKTLTLNNVNITDIHSFKNDMGTDSAGIYYDLLLDDVE